MASEKAVNDYFVERIENVSFANGVFRVSLGTQEENETRSAVRLMIPANQISTILQGMASAARNIDQKVQAKIGQNEEKPAAKTISVKQTSGKRGGKSKK